MAKPKAEWRIGTSFICNRILLGKMKVANNGRYEEFDGEPTDVTDMVIHAFFDYIEVEAKKNPGKKLRIAGRGCIQWIPEEDQE